MRSKKNEIGGRTRKRIRNCEEEVDEEEEEEEREEEEEEGEEEEEEVAILAQVRRFDLK